MDSAGSAGRSSSAFMHIRFIAVMSIDNCEALIVTVTVARAPSFRGKTCSILLNWHKGLGSEA